MSDGINNDKYGDSDALKPPNTHNCIICTWWSNRKSKVSEDWGIGCIKLLNVVDAWNPEKVAKLGDLVVLNMAKYALNGYIKWLNLFFMHPKFTNFDAFVPPFLEFSYENDNKIIKFDKMQIHWNIDDWMTIPCNRSSDFNLFCLFLNSSTNTVLYEYGCNQTTQNCLIWEKQTFRNQCIPFALNNRIFSRWVYK